MKKISKICVVIFPIALIASIILGCGSSSNNSYNSRVSTTNSTVTQMNPIDCDVRDLIDDLEANSLNASEKYKGKTLAVTGYLNIVDAQGNYFSLNAGEKSYDFTSLTFNMNSDDLRNEIKKYSKGDLLLVTCNCISVGEFLGYSFETIKIEDATTAGTTNSNGTATGHTSSATLGEKNALASAKDYLEYSSFSETGLRNQLAFEEYADNEIEYAIANLDVDWKQQAVKMAKSYLDTMSFSKEELRKQLIFEGFTEEQVDYALSEVGY